MFLDGKGSQFRWATTFDSDPRSGHYPCPTLSSFFTSRMSLGWGTDIKPSRKILGNAPDSNADADMFGSELAARTGAGYHDTITWQVRKYTVPGFQRA